MEETHTESALPPPTLPTAPKLPLAKPAFRDRVASNLLTRDKRRSVQIIYDYLAALRAVADTPALESETREFLLDEIEDVLLGADRPVFTAFTLPTAILAQEFANDEAMLEAAQRLLQAARRDISRSTCPNWSDLMLYCRYAAEPVGRMLLALHEVKSPEATRTMDALMAAQMVLQLMRHASHDWRTHGRCYLPTDWFDEEGSTPEHLAEHKMDAGVRRVYDRVLERTQKLLETASALHDLNACRPLKAEMARQLFILQAEHKLLCRNNDLTRPVSTPAFARWWGWWVGRWCRFRGH